MNLRTEDELRREGVLEYSKVKPEIKIVIQGLLTSIRKARLLEPAIGYEIYAIDKKSHSGESMWMVNSGHGW